jgi:hypothetical protein
MQQEVEEVPHELPQARHVKTAFCPRLKNKRLQSLKPYK